MARPAARIRPLVLLTALVLGSCAPDDAGIRRLPLEPTASPGLLEVSPQSAFLGWIGATVPLVGKVATADGGAVQGLKFQWISLDPSIATVNASGQLTAVAEGETRVVAGVLNLADTIRVVVRRIPVTITVAPDSVLFVDLGATRSIASTVLDGGGTALQDSTVSWTSSDTTVAKVSAAGVITSVGQGRATITGKSGQASKSVRVRVSVGPASISVTPNPAVLHALEDTLRITPTVRDAAGGVIAGGTIKYQWQTPGIITVDSTGLVTSHGTGTTNLTVTADTVSTVVSVTVQQVVASVVVAPDSATLLPGATQTFTATVTDSTAHTVAAATVAWSSADTTIAKVSGSGVVTAKGGGTTTITGTAGGVSGTATVTVVDVPVATVDIVPASGTMVVGQTLTFVAKFYTGGGTQLVGPTATWSSSDTAVASVGASSGTVTAKAVGTSWIKAVANDSAAAADSALVTVTAAAGAFGIVVRYVGTTPTAAQQAAFTAAATRWAGVIVGDLTDIPFNIPAGSCVIAHPAINETVDDVVIYAQVDSIDGIGSILGQATPCYVRSGTSLTVMGIMQFDEDDLASLEADGSLTDVITHEMGHVLGFGGSTAWTTTLVGSGGSDPYWPGATAVAEYGLSGGAGLNVVPVANTGGAGTRDAHWRENVMGAELMTGYLNTGTNPLSVITIGALQDIGYTVALGAGDAYTISGSLRLVAAPGIELKELPGVRPREVTRSGHILPYRQR